MIDNPVITPQTDRDRRIQLQLWLGDANTVANASATDLAPADRERLAVMRSAQRRQEWLISRALLRQHVSAGQTYSLSHSGGQATVLVTTDNVAIGVDLEVHRPRDWLRKAALVFSAEEVALLRAAPAGQAEGLFYALWTMKEALAKALGLELMQALTHCCFRRDDQGTWAGRAPTDHPWSVQVFTPHPGVTLAAACVGADRPLIRTGNWPGLIAIGHPTQPHPGR